MTVILVTGGAGFLGSHLVETLLQRGHRVRVLDDLSTGRRANLAAVLDHIELFTGDLCDADLLHRAAAGAGVVFHLVPPRLGTLPDLEDSEAVDGDTLRVLIAARESGVRRVVYASSLRVYGPNPGRPLSEAEPPHPRSAYALAKLSGEQDCTTFTHMYGLETVRLRFANLFGPRQSSPQPYAEVARLLTAFWAGQRPSVPGDGSSPLDLLYVEDAVAAALSAAEAPEVSGQVYNIGRGRPVTARELAAALHRLTGTAVEPLPGGTAWLQELGNLADIARARLRLGYRPRDDLELEMAECLEYYAHPDNQVRLRSRPEILNGS